MAMDKDVKFLISGVACLFTMLVGVISREMIFSFIGLGAFAVLSVSIVFYFFSTKSNLLGKIILHLWADRDTSWGERLTFIIKKLVMLKEVSENVDYTTDQVMLETLGQIDREMKMKTGKGLTVDLKKFTGDYIKKITKMGYKYIYYAELEVPLCWGDAKEDGDQFSICLWLTRRPWKEEFEETDMEIEDIVPLFKMKLRAAPGDCVQHGTIQPHLPLFRATYTRADAFSETCDVAAQINVFDEHLKVMSAYTGKIRNQDAELRQERDIAVSQKERAEDRAEAIRQALENALDTEVGPPSQPITVNKGMSPGLISFIVAVCGIVAFLLGRYVFPVVQSVVK